MSTIPLDIALGVTRSTTPTDLLAKWTTWKARFPSSYSQLANDPSTSTLVTVLDALATPIATYNAAVDAYNIALSTYQAAVAAYNSAMIALTVIGVGAPQGTLVAAQTVKSVATSVATQAANTLMDAVPAVGSLMSVQVDNGAKL